MTLLTILSMGLFSFFKRNENHVLFPDRKQVLETSFTRFDNFFPVATLDLSSRGITAPIHIIYVSFDPAIEDPTLFTKSDNIDEFTFEIMNDGKLKPTFNEKALIITDNFEKYFKKGQKKYSEAKKQIKNVGSFIDFPDEPQWWQYDQTPKNSKGENYLFICELDMDDIVDDDCRMFVFFDKVDKKIKCVYQRT
jgi:hypothetical protein